MFAVACYLGVVATTGLALAAAVAREQESATETLRQRDAQLRVALDAEYAGVPLASDSVPCGFQP